MLKLSINENQSFIARYSNGTHTQRYENDRCFGEHNLIRESRYGTSIELSVTGKNIGQRQRNKFSHRVESECLSEDIIEDSVSAKTN